MKQTNKSGHYNLYVFNFVVLLMFGLFVCSHSVLFCFFVSFGGDDNKVFIKLEIKNVHT